MAQAAAERIFHLIDNLPGRYEEPATVAQIAEIVDVAITEHSPPIDPKALTVDTMKKRVLSLLQQVGEPATCKACDAPMFFVVTRAGRRAPYTTEGLNHFADCPNASMFKKKR